MIVSEEFEYIWESAAGVSFTVQNDTEMFVSRGSQARHEDHFLLGGGPVRVLGGTMLEGSGVDTLRIHRLPHRVARGEIEGEGSDRFR